MNVSKTKMKSGIKWVLAVFALALLASGIYFLYAVPTRLCYSDGSEIEEYTLAAGITSEITDNLGIGDKLFHIKKKTTLDKFCQAKAYYLTDEDSAIVAIDKNGNIKALAGNAEYITNPVDVGNTFSAVVFSAICAENPETVNENPGFSCTGSFTVKDRKLECTAKLGHSVMNFTDSENHRDFFVCPCSQMYFSSEYLNSQLLSEYCKKAGVFKELNIDGLTVGGGKVTADDFNYIGSSVKMSLVQLCRFYSEVCSGGNTYSARIFSSKEKPQAVEVLSPDTADIITHSYLNFLCSDSVKAESRKAIANYSESENSSIAVISTDEYTVVYFTGSGNHKSDALIMCNQMTDFCKYCCPD